MFERLVERFKRGGSGNSNQRDSLEELTEYKEIIEDMQESQFLERIWEKYKEENTYSEGIAFADTLDIVSWIGRELEKY